MNIRFHNPGKIKETELDQKLMTVIVEQKKLNKTFVGYSLYDINPGYLVSILTAGL